MDDDGSDDARFPLKWAVLVLSALVTACGLSRFVV